MQIPLMYFITCSSSILLASNYYESAPLSLTLLLPICLILACAFRFVKWYRTRAEKITYAKAKKTLRITSVMAFLLGAAFIIWAMLLTPYGNAYQKMHGVFFVAITTISCLLCLMHMRRAVAILAITVLIPFVATMAVSDNRTLLSVAINYILVSGAVMVILGRYYDNFVDLVESKRKLQEMHDRIARIADTDSLTDLANRRQFFARLRNAIERTRKNGNMLTIGILDLDGFKPVNDAYGHGAGDNVLIEVADRLRATCLSAECVARLGGDEFGIILTGNYSAQELRIIGLQICLALREPYLVDDVPARISSSIGLASCPEAADTAEKLYECADYALYYAKRHARGAPVLFSADHKVEIRQNSLIDQRLRNSNVRDEIKLAFQPIIDTDNRRPVSFEALARWTDPEIGIIPPEVFIQVAERNGHIGKLTEILLEKALQAASSWPGDLYLSFNLSAYDIASREAAGRIDDIIRNSGVPTSRIDLEVTETAIMLDFDRARQTLNMLKDRGVRISLDDFGSGYSSLSYVHQLPLDRIKIDRSFVANIENDKVSVDVVRTIIDMCESLKLDCVVEGIETERQVDVMREMGCRWMQGYLFAKPMSAESIPDFIRHAGRQNSLNVPITRDLREAS